MISQRELSVMSRQTKAFIDADYEEISIEPRTNRVSDGAGGWLETPEAPGLPIRVRMIPQSDNVPAAASPEGSRPIPDFVLMAMPGTNIERYDTFDWRGKTWEVSYVHEKPEYELKADVIIHAG